MRDRVATRDLIATTTITAPVHLSVGLPTVALAPAPPALPFVIGPPVQRWIGAVR
jgi:hypothetical protein